MKDEELLQRITVDPRVMVGKPVIRGTRIPVALILKMLGQRIPTEEILHEYPRLEEVDIHAAMIYAALRTRLSPTARGRPSVQAV